jgi:hypothetical protein
MRGPKAAPQQTRGTNMQPPRMAARGCALALSCLALSATALAGDGPILPSLKSISLVASTVPSNGDINPYGVAQVKSTIGNLRAGHILVSNFNNSTNAQGTGTTIVQIGPDGGVTAFATIHAASLPGACPGGVGLTTALVVLQRGWVIVGSLPTKDGTAATAQAGCLIVLDSMGRAVETFYGSLINGPWDMTALDGDHAASLFVTNVLNGTVAAKGAVVHAGTVTRLNLQLSSSAMPALESITVIGSTFAERTDPAALVLGPTGVALHTSCARADDCTQQDDGDSALYVADTLNNRITWLDHPLLRTSSAGLGHVLSAGGSLNAPLGLVETPEGHLLTVNGGDGFITEIAPTGAQVAKRLLDNSGSPPGAGALFGLVFDPLHGVYFVDDAVNTLMLLH